MKQEVNQHRNSVKVAVLVFTAVVLTLAVLNFLAQWNSESRTDGVTWVYSNGSLIAGSVEPGSSGEKAGIRKGDKLLKVGPESVLIPQDVGKILKYKEVPGKPFQYDIFRNGVTVTRMVYLQQRNNSLYFYLAFIGFVFLAIGVFAFLKSKSRLFALHFYLLCLGFFGVYAFSPEKTLTTLDWVFFWADTVSLLVLAPLFVHFAMYFPGKTERIKDRNVRWLYLPSVMLLAGHVLITVVYFLFPANTVIPTVQGYLSYENLEILYAFMGLFAGVVILFLSYAREQHVVRKKQLKLVVAGLVAGFAPFCFLWLVSLVVHLPQQVLEAAVIPQVLVPLSLTYALFKYRLMDVDIMIKRGMIYTVTTLVLFGLYLLLTISWVQYLLPQATLAKTVTVASLTTLLASLLFNPLREKVRSLVDRFYYKDSYDYRRTLVQFSREITSSFDLQQLSESIVKHITSTFKTEEADLMLKVGMNRFESVGRRSRAIHPGLGFLTRLACDPFVFLDSFDSLDPDLQDDEDHFRNLNLNYFIPCRFKHNVVAILAVSKREKGDYLTSEDLDLLTTLANQLAIVIENHHLFYTLKTKADEVERLKDFNENILLSLNVGIVTIDETGKIVACNNYIESFLGLNRVVVLGHSLDELFPTAIVDRYRNYSLKAPRKKLEGSRFYKTLVENFRQKDVVVNLSFVPLINDADVEYGTIMILDDVTHQAKLEEQLTQAEKLSALGMLAAGVAHEVNTPLTGISSYTQFLESSPHMDAESREILQKIEQQTFRASKIINTLLDLSRPEPEPFMQIDINHLLKDTLALLKPHFKDSAVQVVQEYDPAAPLIMGNEGKLQQVFTNLVLNAKDAMSGGGTLCARTESSGDFVRISIIDSGAGIDEKSLKRIYEPFFTTKKGMKGTGLGLAITYAIVQEHKGAIDVMTEEGKGTHFQITLATAKREVREQSNAYSGD